MFHTIVSIKNDGHYFCRAGGNRPDGLNEPVTLNSCLPKTIRCYKNKRVDWSERDIISSSLINDVLSQGQYSMSLTSLDALLGGHGWLLKYRDKLPMTMILLRKMELIK